MKRPAIPRLVVLAIAIAALSACSPEPTSSGKSTGRSTSGLPPIGSVATFQTPPIEFTAPDDFTAAAGPDATCPAMGPGVVSVETADQLTAALAAAVPETVIVLADGTYAGNFVASDAGTAQEPIVMCGSRAAVLDAGGPKEGYVLHLDGASGWQFLGFSVTNGQKGIMADGAVGNLIQGVSVSHIGDEAIHLRGFSTDNIVRGNVIRDTGLRKAKFGEGIYIGSADSNWCTITDCEPDRSDRNLIEGNDIAQTSSESIDIKEGTTGGVVRGNTFSGLGMTGADSWVDVKGNGWLIESNVGTDAPTDGMQVHQILVDWGQGNIFDGNTLNVNADGYGINDTKRDSIVKCTNVVSGAGQGLSPADCR